MNKIILFLFLIIPITLSAQEKTDKTMSIIGTSKLSVSPDIGILNVQVSIIDTDFNKSISKLGAKTNEYIKLFTSLGFKENDIKTTSFSVTKNRIYRRDETIDSGYIASQKVKLEFANDQKVLSKILNKLSSAQPEVDFSFDFKLSEKLKQEIQNKLIESAILDAKSKAELVSKTSGIKLKAINNIAYGQNHMSGMQQIELQFGYAAKADTRAYNFTPEELVFQDSVTIEWFIE